MKMSPPAPLSMIVAILAAICWPGRSTLASMPVCLARSATMSSSILLVSGPNHSPARTVSLVPCRLPAGLAEAAGAAAATLGLAASAAGLVAAAPAAGAVVGAAAAAGLVGSAAAGLGASAGGFAAGTAVGAAPPQA